MDAYIRFVLMPKQPQPIEGCTPLHWGSNFIIDIILNIFRIKSHAIEGFIFGQSTSGIFINSSSLL